jgi:hypothetical protein
VSRRKGDLAAAKWGIAGGASLAAAAAVFAALAVVSAHASAGSSVVRGSGDLTGLVLNCNTDTVTLSGSYRYTENASVRQSGNGTWFSRGTFAFDLEGVSGTGTSGLSYRVVGATSIDFAFFFGGTYGGGDVEHSTETWHLVPSDGGTPLSFQQTFVLVSTPAGTTTLVDQGSGDCT